jgi:peroxiredoxin/tetratricopeptide (TPR) repeat protein
VNLRTICAAGLAAACLAPIAGRALSQTAATPPAASAASSTPAPIKPGHSHNGAAFDEGPRQKSRLLRGYGAVHFPITTANPQAQRFFDQGINQLYSFSYFEAERSFRTAAMLDPDCAMAYWGMSRCESGGERARTFLKLAQQHTAKITDRERRYIAAEAIQIGPDKVNGQSRDAAYIGALEQLVLAYPNDLEAKVQLEWALPNEVDGKSNRIAKDALLREVLARNPNHPGAHHYRIHLWDGKNGAAALDSCRAYPHIAPAIGHAQHMPGHIYAQLGMWNEAADAMDRAARVERNYFYSDGRMPFDSWNYAHDQHYLIANLGYLGRIQEGTRLAQELLDVPHDPQANPMGDSWGGTLEGQGRFALMRMRVRGEQWDAILNDTGWIAEGSTVGWKYYSLGLAYLGKGDLDHARKQLKALEDLKDNSDQMKCAVLELRGRLAIADGKLDTGLEALKQAAQTEKAEFFNNDPPGLPRPMYEALAWGYLQARRWSDAESALNDGLVRDPHNGFALAMLALAQNGAGRTREAAQTYAQLRTVWQHADADLPLLHQVQAFAARNRALCGDAGFAPTAYRSTPELERLGPALWQPFPAAPFTLADPNGKMVRLSDYRGHNVLLVFTLGAACQQCLEQLDALGKEKRAFDALDTRLIGVSSDAPLVAHSYLKSQPNYPWLLLSDPTGAVRRAYKAYDDFEQLELHATVLIDRAGRVWWFRSGGDPFTDAAFLKAEIARMDAWYNRHSTR